MQDHRDLYGDAGAFVSVHGKKNEQGLALEPFSVTLQVRDDRGVAAHPTPPARAGCG